MPIINADIFDKFYKS